MNYFLKFILTISIVLISACQNNDEKISIIEERDLDLQMIDAYNEGLNLLDDNYPLKAAEKFNEAELLYPQSLWAARSSLMSAYSFYYGSYYVDAIDSKALKTASGGFIPNFANPLQDAINREAGAGVPKGKIRVESSSKLRSPANPGGLAVTNTRDEPMGVNQGIRRAQKMGADPKKFGMGGFAGLIPNFKL